MHTACASCCGQMHGGAWCRGDWGLSGCGDAGRRRGAGHLLVGQQRWLQLAGWLVGCVGAPLPSQCCCRPDDCCVPLSLTGAVHTELWMGGGMHGSASVQGAGVAGSGQVGGGGWGCSACPCRQVPSSLLL